MITVAEQIVCVKRELVRRKQLYPKLVEEGKLNLFESEKEIRVMEAVIDSLLLMPRESSLLGVNK